VARHGGRSEDEITIVIADDHRAFGDALKIALGEEDDLLVIEVTTSGDDVVDAATKEHPDIAIVDLEMPGVDGAEATRRIRQGSPRTDVIILTGEEEETSLGRAIEAGARGLLSKSETVHEVADAVRRAHRGEPLHRSAEVDAALRIMRERRAIDGNLAKRVSRLTPREVQILQAMADGLTPDQISAKLGISRHTLRTHTQNILTKLAVHSKTDAVIAAIRFGKVRTRRVTPGMLPPTGQ
jgi:DNA-binding NarL/FixJ family response regulator